MLRQSHYRPQLHYNATCGLVFSEPQENDKRKAEMYEYYKRLGIKFWCADFETVLKRAGFLQLGTLKNYDKDDPEVRKHLRNLVKTSDIVNWSIKDT